MKNPKFSIGNEVRVCKKGKDNGSGWFNNSGFYYQIDGAADSVFTVSKVTYHSDRDEHYYSFGDGQIAEHALSLVVYDIKSVPSSKYLECLNDAVSYMVKGRVYEYIGKDSKHFRVTCNVKCGNYRPGSALYEDPWNFKATTKEAYEAQVKPILPNSALSNKHVTELKYPDAIHIETKEEYDKIRNAAPHLSMSEWRECYKYYLIGRGISGKRSSYEKEEGEYVIYEMDQLIFPKLKAPNNEESTEKVEDEPKVIIPHKEELLRTAKNRYSVNTVFKCLHLKKLHIVTGDVKFKYEEDGCIRIFFEKIVACVYDGNEWAKVIKEEPKTVTLEQWLEETKKKNLSLKELEQFIKYGRTCPFNEVYSHLEGYDSQEKAKILFKMWNSKFQVGDLIIGKSNNYRITHRGWIGEVVKVMDNCIRVKGPGIKNREGIDVNPEDFELVNQSLINKNQKQNGKQSTKTAGVTIEVSEFTDAISIRKRFTGVIIQGGGSSASVVSRPVRHKKILG